MTIQDILNWFTSFVGITLLTALVVLAVLFFGRNYISRQRRRILNWISPLGVDVWMWLQQLTRRTPSASNPPASTKSNHPTPVKAYPWVYLAALGIAAVVCVFAEQKLEEYSITLLGDTLNLGYAFLIICLMYLVSGRGIKIIDRNELAGIFFLGVPTIEVTGLPILLIPGMKLVRVELTPVDVSFPKDSNKVFRGGKDEPVPEGYEVPLRVTFASQEHGKLGTLPPPSAVLAPGTVAINLKERIREDNVMLNQLTQEVSFVVRVAPTHGRFFEFYVQVKDRKNLWVQTLELTRPKVYEEFTHVSAAEAFAALNYYNGLLEEHLRGTLGRMGVTVFNAKILFTTSHSLNLKLEQVAQGSLEGQEIALKAVGERTDRILKGQGDAQAIKLKLDAETEGLKKRAEDLDIKGADVLGASVASDIGTSSSTKIVLGAGALAEALGLSKVLSNKSGS